MFHILIISLCYTNFNVPKRLFSYFNFSWLLVIIGVAGGAYYFGKSSVKLPSSSSVSVSTSQNSISPTQPPIKTTVSPSPTIIDETANWETYNGISYTFKYPSDWITSKDVGLFNDPSMHFILDVQTKTTTLNIQDWTKANICTKFAKVSDQNGCTVYASGPIENSIQFTFLTQYGGMHTVFKYGNTIYDVSIDAREPNPNFEEIKKVYDQILSTFKFLP